MAWDMEIRLAAAPGSIIPPECFAALRHGGVQASTPPKQCSPHEVTLLGLAEYGGTAIVDLFQRVGSVTIGPVEPGAGAEVAVAWPGLGDLRLCVAIAATEADVAQSEPLPTSPPLTSNDQPLAVRRSLTLPPLGEERLQDIGKELVEQGKVRRQASLLPAGEERVQDIGKDLSSRLSPPRARIPTPRGEEPTGQHYRPISLENCNKIIPNLYLGGIAAATDSERLVEQGIRAVVCCCMPLEFPDKEFHPELDYCRVEVEDISREPIEAFFEEATEFIHKWIIRQQPVLVHCRAGVSRSASIVIAYLIAKHDHSLHDAFFLARSHRSIVTPNIGFMEKLGKFEEERRDTEPTIEINKYINWYSIPDRAAVPDLKPD